MSPAQKTSKPASEKTAGFTAEERAAMKEYARELKAQARADRTKADGEKDLLTKIAEMAEPDRAMAARLHELVSTTAPELFPRTWYGMPAYATGDGKVLCFFQSAQKFGVRYATLGFNDVALLDDGAMWPTAYALTALGTDEEARVVELVKRAVNS